MKRSPRPGILLTVGAVAGTLGCTGLVDRVTDRTGETRNPPEPTYNPPAYVATFPSPPFVAGQALEARDGAGRLIHHGGGGCWVDLPFETPPTSVVPPPTEAVPCPPALSEDPAYAACEYGEVHLASLGPPAACECFFFGNPPPPSKPVACPTLAIPSLADAAPPPVEPSRNPPNPEN